MSRRIKSIFIFLLVSVLTVVMAVPVSATSYSQRKKASQKMFKAIYYGKYSKSYNYGSAYRYSYDLDINKDGWPEHIDNYFDRNIVVVYTSYKNKVRRYVFENAEVYKYKKQIVVNLWAGAYQEYQEWRYYTIKNGKLIEDYKKRLTEIYSEDEEENEDSSYFRGDDTISLSSLMKSIAKVRDIKSSSYWSKLFNATRNFG